MRNQYKRLDVFRCRLQSHDSFAGRVSVYHVLKVKRCLPEGCIWFDWRCRLLEKGGACRKGYHFPGKNCNGCRYYYEEKVHKVPEVLLDRDSYRNFQAELEEFEDWLRENLGRRLEVFARVSQVGPQLTKLRPAGWPRQPAPGWLPGEPGRLLPGTHPDRGHGLPAAVPAAAAGTGPGPRGQAGFRGHAGGGPGQAGAGPPRTLRVPRPRRGDPARRTMPPAWSTPAPLP